MEKETATQTTIRRYPKRIITSFQLGNLVGLMMSQMYSQQLAYFYLGVVGLDYTFYLIAMILYMVFNMINDPLLGYFCDRSTRFTKRWGKRFPFIVMGAIPWCFIVIFVFSAPSTDEIGHFGVFLWFLIFLCINDTVFSLYDINRIALFPDKFRDNKDRRWAGAVTVVLETIGILLGILIPVLTIEIFGTIGWTIQAIIVALVSFVFMMLMIPGVHESPEMKERRISLDKKAPEPFFSGLKFTLKDRNFVGYLVLYVSYTSGMGLVMASIPFFVKDFLKLPKLFEIILLFYIVAVVAGAPLWYKLSFRLGIKKVAIIGGCVLASILFMLLFVPFGPEGLILVICICIIAGFFDGALICMTMPIFSSAVDNSAVKTRKRREGLYHGTFVFFSRIGIAIQAIVIWLVYTFTGYHSGSTSPSELMGIKIQISVFPMIIIGIGVLLFWSLYRLTPEMLEANAARLRELNL